jgi:predicted RNA-binding Zn-ribbon protein involved in translation (DUF1610 family)
MHVSAICPHCGENIMNMSVEAMDAKDGPNKTWKAAAFICPYCRKVLGASFDSLAHTNHILEEIKKMLRR